MPDFYDQSQDEPEPLNIGVYPVEAERPRMSRNAKIAIGGVSAALLLAIGIGVASSSSEATSTPSTSTPSSAPSTSAPTSTWTPSETLPSATVEPFIPSASVVWSTYFDADDRADVCAETNANKRHDTFNMAAYSNVEDIISRHQYSVGQTAAAIDCPKPKPVTYRTVTERELAKVIRDPDGHIGEGYVVYGEVSQFDSATGLDSFRADVANRNTNSSYGYFDGENSMFEGSESALEDLIDGDVFKAKVVVKGSVSYSTTMGGSTTVPVFTVTWIDQIGHND